MNKNRILFIINPIAGKGRSGSMTKLIDKYLDNNLFEYQVKYTQYSGHGAEIARLADNYDIIAAVGGDGTINEVASVLVGSDKTLAIIPIGSGNGLAYHLGISNNPPKALQTINEMSRIRIDTARINDKFFFCSAGAGFDGKVAHLYSKDKSRGLITYIKKTLSVLSTTTAENYRLELDGKQIIIPALLITCGNSNQWGNNFYITPSASLTDGLLNITIVKKANLFQMIILIAKLLKGNLKNCNYVQTYTAAKIKINKESGGSMYAHYDGEPYSAEELDITINPQSLLVLGANNSSHWDIITSREKFLESS